MSKIWIVVSLAIVAIIPGACSVAAKATSDRDPVVYSTDHSLQGAVVDINGYKYNCIKYSTVERGGLWCERINGVAK